MYFCGLLTRVQILGSEEKDKMGNFMICALVGVPLSVIYVSALEARNVIGSIRRIFNAYNIKFEGRILESSSCQCVCR